MYTLKMHVIHNLATGPIELAAVVVARSDNWDWIHNRKIEVTAEVGHHDSPLRNVFRAVLAMHPEAGAVRVEFRMHA